MDCCKTDVVSLMQSGVRFHIPFYQRPYEWGEYQCQVLLDDLDLVRAQLPNPAPHFLGTLVVHLNFPHLGTFASKIVSS